MNYFALFLNNNSYIEDCLAIIKHINNPSSNSLPHITLYTYYDSTVFRKLIGDKEITYLNIIKPGTFNLDQENRSCFVFMECESKELRLLEYKPDFPYSKLHITLYEGYDKKYAEEVYSLLNSFEWKVRLSFPTVKKLSEYEKGADKDKEDSFYNIRTIYEKIMEESYKDFRVMKNENKIQHIKIVLSKIQNHLLLHSDKYEKVESYWLESIKDSAHQSAKYFDRSNKNIFKNNIDNNEYNEIIKKIKHEEVHDSFHVTPPDFATDVARLGLEIFRDDSTKIDFGDPTVGTGVLFIAIDYWMSEYNKKENKNFQFNSAVGVEIIKKMSEEAYVRCGKNGLSIIHGDALSPDINLGTCRNMILANPPYTKNSRIPIEYRNQLNKLVKEQLGISVKKTAGLYVYHILLMDKWLCENGVAVWLMPTAFLQAKYGDVVREYLVNKVDLIRLHVYDEYGRQFDNAMVAPTIIAFRKSKPQNSKQVTISFGETVTSPSYIDCVNRDVFSRSMNNWREIVHKTVSGQSFEYNDDNTLKFSDLFIIKRGIATGANKFFVMERTEAKEHKIPEIALKPLLPKSRYIDSDIVNANDDGYPDVYPELVLIDCDLDEITIKAKYPLFYEYLQSAKASSEGEKPIIKGRLISNRKIWYKQEKRESPPFLLTYMGRSKGKSSPLRFIMNKSKAVALNTYILLYPKKWLKKVLDNEPYLYDKLHSLLNETAREIFLRKTRVYSGGLHKLEPGELRKLPIIDLPIVVINAYNENKNQ